MGLWVFDFFFASHLIRPFFSIVCLTERAVQLSRIHGRLLIKRLEVNVYSTMMLSRHWRSKSHPEKKAQSTHTEWIKKHRSNAKFSRIWASLLCRRRQPQKQMWYTEIDRRWRLKKNDNTNNDETTSLKKRWLQNKNNTNSFARPSWVHSIERSNHKTKHRHS